ncbi:hypothetical protein [Saccharospirillum impatiens]|uniref:hypothetical protein n=1 Tax=Saccharospirillum impatiens TaxID=169438 RepID=UPI00040B3671|nr:hypothetical protein [Saccharospirillum impatiens]
MTHRPDEPPADQTPVSGWRDAIRRPTFWVVLVLLIGFVYLQWPSRLKPIDQPDYVSTTVNDAITIEWEASPSAQSDPGTDTEAWFLRRRGMDFLVQTGDLTQPLPELAERMLATDREQVAGDVYEPLQSSGLTARYALYDAENRIQRHRLYATDAGWVKISVLYKGQNEEREARAQRFINRVTRLQ